MALQGSTLHAVSAQVTRLRFLGPPLSDSAVAGLLKLHVSADPLVRPSWTAPAFAVDGKVILMLSKLPASFLWDTERASDGLHTLQILLVKPRGSTQTHPTVIDSITVQVLNGTPRDTHVASPLQAEIHKPGPIPQAKNPPTVIVPVTRTVVDAVPTPAPLAQVPAALSSWKGILYIGLRNGAVTEYDGLRHSAISIPVPTTSGAVTSIAGGDGTLLWLTGTSGVASGRAVGEAETCTLYAYKASTRELTAYSVAGRLPFRAARCALWRGKFLLFGEQDGCVLDQETGAVEPLGSVLPQLAVTAARDGGMFFAADQSAASLVVLGTLWPAHGAGAPRLASTLLQCWQAGSDGRWSGPTTTTLPGPASRIARALYLSASMLASAGPDSVSSIPLREGSQPPALIPVHASLPAWVLPNTVSCGAGHVWYLRGGAVFHADVATGTSDAFLGWNEPGLKASTLVADGEGAWIGTNAGIRHIDLAHSTTAHGYDGFLRLRLDQKRDTASTGVDLNLAAEIRSWQGVPYKWGGDSRAGTDCSGFVEAAFHAIGVALPHGTDYLRSCKPGRIVTDELQYGDVLVYPGHCAIYTGDGRTAETVDKQVSTATVWSRTSVVVRRFLNGSGPRSGPPGSG